MTKVALSGAGGNMGRVLRVELQKRGIDLRSAGGRTPLEPLHDGEDVMWQSHEPAGVASLGARCASRAVTAISSLAMQEASHLPAVREHRRPWLAGCAPSASA